MFLHLLLYLLLHFHLDAAGLQVYLRIKYLGLLHREEFFKEL
jgi:hypothetical protein